MALKTFVKISGVNNLSDARYCAGMGVNQLGFNIEDKHPNYTDPQLFKELSDWVSGVDFVGEFDSLSAQGKVAEVISQYDLYAIQVSESSMIDEACETGKEVIYSASSLADASSIASQFGDKIAYILLEDEQAEPSSLEALASETELVIASGFSTDNLEDVLGAIQPKGIALKGGDEIRPGYKDFDQMADILEALDADEWV